MADPSRPLEPIPRRNRLLASLDPATLARIAPLLSTVTLERRRSIWEPHEPIRRVYFPIDCVISFLALSADGRSVEIGTVGNEGLAGLPVSLGATTTAVRCLVQVSGTAYCMEAEAFRREALREAALASLIQRYTVAFMTQISQTVICNRVHTTEQRLARWLLMVHDRVGRDEFPLTHAFVAQMLAVGRSTVTAVARALEARRLIRYGRGTLAVLDRAGLEAAACECYRLVRDEFDRLLGVPVG